MKKYQILYSPEASHQIEILQQYIQDKAGTEIADAYITRIRKYCDKLSSFPRRGTKHDEISLGLRLICYKKRITIAFKIYANDVVIVGVFYGGQDIEKLLSDKSK